MKNYNRFLKSSFIALVLLVNSNVFFAQSHYPGQHQGKLAVKETANFKALAFDLKDVKLLDSRFTENMERESKWILSLSTNRLLHNFRTNAGVRSSLKGGYNSVEKLRGWESLDCELRGHSVGHILSGLALLHATTQKEVYKIKSDSLVSGLAEVQKVLNQEGYLSAFPQSFIDRNIAGTPVWAPWYTLHKMFAGLMDQYLYCDNKQALEVAKKMSHWAFAKLSTLTPEQRKVMLRNEFGGINDSFYTLYEITANKNDKWLGDFFYNEEVLDPLESGKDNLEKQHANTYIPKLIGAVRGYEIGEAEKNKKIANFFWDTVINHHSYANGSNSDKEHFFEPDHISEHLTGQTGESCNVYNMLKLTRHLYSLDGSLKYADYYEKALYNHILGQQDTETGMVAYFMPMLPGAFKLYSNPNSFWCCVGTGFENHAKYGEAIYYHKNENLFVNLFIPSELNWKDQNVHIRQETNFPQEANSKFIITTERDKKWTLNLRYPSWAKNGVTVSINGKKIKIKQNPSSYIVISRIWKNEDTVVFEYPMELQVQPSDNPNVASFSYGPIVLAAKMGTEGMAKPEPYSDINKVDDYYTYDYHVPASLSNTLNVKGKNINQWLKPVEGLSLTFKMDKKVTGQELNLIPLYDLHRERYILYWNLQK